MANSQSTSRSSGEPVLITGPLDHTIDIAPIEPEPSLFDAIKEAVRREIDSTNPRHYLPAELCTELGGVSTATLNKWAKAAGVRTPRRGGRNHRYSVSDRQRIYSKIIDAGSDSELVTRCRKLLRNRN